MAGITQTAWVATTVNGHLVLQCDVSQASTELYDSFTYKTPKELDPTKPWLLFVNTEVADIGTTAVPVDIWAGYDVDAALAGATTDVTATSAYIIKASIMDDLVSVMLASRIDPNYTGTTVQAASGVAGHVNAGTPPYFIINCNGAAELDTATCHFVITQ